MERVSGCPNNKTVLKTGSIKELYNVQRVLEKKNGRDFDNNPSGFGNFGRNRFSMSLP